MDTLFLVPEKNTKSPILYINYVKPKYFVSKVVNKESYQVISKVTFTKYKDIVLTQNDLLKLLYYHSNVRQTTNFLYVKAIKINVNCEQNMTFLTNNKSEWTITREGGQLLIAQKTNPE